jgi:hypothetical protein
MSGEGVSGFGGGAGLRGLRGRGFGIPGAGRVEFTFGRHVRRRGLGLLCAGAAGVLGGLGWMGLRGMPPDPTAPIIFLVFFTLIALLGARELLRLRKPFRLVVDAHGITLHDGALGWDQIESVALRYIEAYSDETDPRPRLTVWPVAGATLPREPDRTRDGELRYTLVEAEELDQGVPALSEALARHAGARYATAPRSLAPAAPNAPFGAPVPLPQDEQVFTASQGTGARLLAWLAVSALLTVPLVLLLATGHLVGPREFNGVVFVLMLVAWTRAGRALGRFRRPLRLRVGPDGVGMREFSSPEQLVAWHQVAAVSVGPRPRRPGRPPGKHTAPWLTLWLLPGSGTGLPYTDLVEGHQAYAVVRLDRLPGGAPAVLPALLAHAGDRFDRPWNRTPATGAGG